MAVIVVLCAFCWIKNTKIDFWWGFTPDPTWLANTAPPDVLVDGQEGGGLGAPVPKNLTPALAIWVWSFGPLDYH